MVENKTVIYRHTTLDTNEVFYIGIGTPKRPYQNSQRSKFWKRVVAKHGYYVEVLKRDLTWADACELERTLITYYGRRDLGLGTLVNLTDGGDGVQNRIVTIEMRIKIGIGNTGRPQSEESIDKRRQKLLGFKHTDESRKKMSDFQKEQKGIEVIDTATGIIYSTIAKASEASGIKARNLRRYLNGTRKPKPGIIITFKYLEEC